MWASSQSQGPSKRRRGPAATDFLALGGPPAGGPRFRRTGSTRRKRVSRARRGPLRSLAGGGATQILNVFPQREHRVVKTIRTYGNLQPGGGVDMVGTLVFDPSGTYDTSSLPMPDWSNYVPIFDQYRVNKIKVTMIAVQTASSTVFPPAEIYGRYNYDTQISSSVAVLMEMPRVKWHRFTVEQPAVSWDIYPTEVLDGKNDAVLASQAQVVIPDTWTDIDAPSKLYGFIYAAPSFPTGISIRFNVEYDVSFRYEV
jgi:hypothetical protein